MTRFRISYLLLLIFSTIHLALVPVKKSEIKVEQTIRPLLLEFTSTGCPGCGGWGNPTFKSLAKQYKDKVTPLAIHIKYGDPMITETSNEIAANRTGRLFTPQIAVNNENGVVVSRSIEHQASLNKIDQLIKKHSQLEAPFIGAKLTKNKDRFDFEYLINHDTYKEKTNQISLAVYLVEDGISYRQAGSDNQSDKHNFVIREAWKGSFGQKIELSSSKEAISGKGSIEFNSKKVVPENAYLVFVLWEKKGEGYQAINSFKAI